MKPITEDDIEQAAVNELVTQHGYIFLKCMTELPEILPDGSGRSKKSQVVLPEILRESLIKINPTIPKETIELHAKKLENPSSYEDIRIVNYDNYKKIRNGITISYKKETGDIISDKLKLVDFDQPRNNVFHVVSQLWIRGDTNWRRPDLLLYVNGLPLVFIELKNSNHPVKNAYDKNLTDYKRDIPFLFDYNQIAVLSNGIETRIGSFSARYEYFFEWLKVESENENPNREYIRNNGISLKYFIDGLCKPENLLDYIENFILYDRKTTKIIAKNHQFFGVNNAFQSVKSYKDHPGKLGVFWHTQGSGKSYSMRMLAGKIDHRLNGHYTFLVITDRDDLDGQIYKNFLRTEFVSDGEDVRPANSKELQASLKSNKKILFTLIQKFRVDKKGEKYPLLSDRDDIIVIVDEAHRSEYHTFAENMRTGLPNAQYLAFTGTPLLGTKRLTNQWFGGYVSEYNFADSIKDNATVPLYYIKGVPKVQVINDCLEEEFDNICKCSELTDDEIKRVDNKYGRIKEVIKREDRLKKIAKDIVNHFSERKFRGKGMVISIDKFTTVRMYDYVSFYWKDKIRSLREEACNTDDSEKKEHILDVVKYMKDIEMAVVISSSNTKEEEEEFSKEGLNIDLHWKRMAKIDEDGADIEDNFKNPDHRLSLVFVCGMWLTGFDAPNVSTIYLDKPMKDHTLMQTIARANRVFPGKECGLIVDYIGVFKYLNKALSDYADGSDENNLPVKDIESLLDKLNETIEYTNLFCMNHGVDLLKIENASSNFEELEMYNKSADIIVNNDDVKNEFRILSNTVSNLYNALCPDIFNNKFSMNFNSTRKRTILYLRDIIDGKIRPEKIEKARAEINKLLDESISAVENANGYSITTSNEIDLSKLNVEELRGKFRETKNKNLAISDLRIFIEKKLKQMIVKNDSRVKFSEQYRKIIDAYNAGGSENEVYYEKLIKLIEDLNIEDNRHIYENMTEEELDIYDLLIKENLTKEEEKKVKFAAKSLYHSLNEKRDTLFLVGWEKDSQPQQVVRNEINSVLDEYLPECYLRDIFEQKINTVFERIVKLARTGGNWVRAEV